jgi:predicted phosphodiesterase
MWDPSIPTEQLLPFGKHKILITHGHLFGVKGGLGGLIAHAAELGADIVLFGHTHEPTERVIPAGTVVDGAVLSRPIYLFNPGSIGVGPIYSFGLLSFNGGEVLPSHGTFR